MFIKIKTLLYYKMQNRMQQKISLDLVGQGANGFILRNFNK